MKGFNLRIVSTLVLFIMTTENIQSQSANDCIVSITELVPARFLDSNVYFNPEDDIENLVLVFNETWVEQTIKPGKYCRADFLRNATKKDMRNPKIQPALYYQGKDAWVSIDESKFYHDSKIYTYNADETQFANWLKIKASDYQNEDITKWIFGTECYPGNILPDKFEVVDLNQFKDVPVHLIYYDNVIVW